MKYRKIANWTNIDEMRGLLFFAQRLDELSYPYSLDSYKSATISLRGLVFEAMELVEEAQGLDDDKKNAALSKAAKILDELKFRISGNQILRRCSTIDLDALLNFDSKEHNTTDTLRRLTVTFSEIGDEHYISELVEEVIKLAATNSKDQIDLCARELCSTLQLRGISRDHINSTVCDFFFGTRQIDDALCIKDFCRLVYPHHHQFRVVLGVDSNIAALDPTILQRRGIDRTGEDGLFPVMPDEEPFNNELLEKLRSDTDLDTLILARVQAADYESAVMRAKMKIEEVENLFKLFNHKASFPITSYALVEQACCGGIVKSIDAPRNQMHYIRDMRQTKASSVLKRFDDSISLDTGADSSRFNNIVNIHGMSLSSDNPDVQIVNLWTCLETMTPSEGYSTNISKVVDRVIPPLMLGYINRLVVNLLFDIIRWDRNSLKSSLRIAGIDKRLDLRTRFIILLVDKASEPALLNLLDRCRDFELLKHRIKEIAELLRSTKKSARKIRAHEEMVRWQLHRIYRARNRIVHAGSGPEYGRYLVENAHDFFDSVLMFCMELSSWKSGFSTFSSCFAYAEHRYRQYLVELDEEQVTHAAWTLPKMKGRQYILGY
ncbi:hypothetical protein GU927_003270 [Rhodobacteraceae bacterium HSP-20]|uniref:Apea-like HEPN domain-containing protein n=1 Tax=Paragemmobacter amnigenus TaxID=2852097 RepID=A0ABS6J005_9RHOB|nr:hypothetical protein [Rhodobacter amnigenus]MBU9696862.1 hypothetical protein [Rhodobacter amnigenus]MBV4388089.1 hypothetical protein [Rhodobacter amnigenus]